MREWGGPEASAEKAIAIPTPISSGGGSPQPLHCKSVPPLLGSGVNPSILTFWHFTKKIYSFVLNLNILPQTTKYNSLPTTA